MFATTAAASSSSLAFRLVPRLRQSRQLSLRCARCESRTYRCVQSRGKALNECERGFPPRVVFLVTSALSAVI